MAAKTTFCATCPFTGETVTRTSCHPYTHALAVRITRVMEPVPGTEVRYVDRVSQVPMGWTLVHRPGRAHRGCAWKLQPIAGPKEPESVGIVSFHESEALARAKAHSLEWAGMRRVEFVAVPVVVQG